MWNGPSCRAMPMGGGAVAAEVAVQMAQATPTDDRRQETEGAIAPNVLDRARSEYIRVTPNESGAHLRRGRSFYSPAAINPLEARSK